MIFTLHIRPGVEHLSLAVAVCGQPHSLLSVLQQTLPPQIYQLLLQNLVWLIIDTNEFGMSPLMFQDVAQQKVRVHASSSMMNAMRGGGAPRESSIEAEDVE